MASYGSGLCWLCLCEVCTRRSCRKLNRRYTLDFCFSMILRERCPVVKCEQFEHKQKHRYFRVARRHRAVDRLSARLAVIEGLLAKLVEKG